MQILKNKLFMWQTLLIIGAMALSIGIRISDHLPNVTPVAAVALLAGAYWRKPWSLLAPVLVMLISDYFVGFYQWQIMASVYGSMLLMVGLGGWLRGRWNSWRVVGTSLAASILFYLITNAAVWKLSGLYPVSLDGLALSYYYGIPFFRNSLLGNMAYTFGLFLVMEYAPRLAMALSTKLSGEKTQNQMAKS